MNKNVTFLIVDDDEVDVMTLKRAFKKLKVANPQITAKDGIEGLEYLRGEGGKKKIEEPFIVLLDLNMPRMNGLEFLEEIRKDESLKQAIIFVMSTSDSDQDRLNAYNKNIAGYILKSDPAEGFTKAIEMLDHYWRVVELPDVR